MTTFLTVNRYGSVINAAHIVEFRTDSRHWDDDTTRYRGIMLLVTGRTVELCASTNDERVYEAITHFVQLIVETEKNGGGVIDLQAELNGLDAKNRA